MSGAGYRRQSDHFYLGECHTDARYESGHGRSTGANLWNGGNYFEVLGVQALLGRGFLSEEDKTPGPHPVAVIGYGLWQRRFGGAPDVTGQTATLNNQRFTIISVNLRRSRVLRPGWLSISGLR
jgi:hypothetical protein